MRIAAFHDGLAELAGDPGGAAHRIGDDRGRPLGEICTNFSHFRAFAKNWFEIGLTYVPLSPRPVKPGWGKSTGRDRKRDRQHGNSFPRQIPHHWRWHSWPQHRLAP